MTGPGLQPALGVDDDVRLPSRGKGFVFRCGICLSFCCCVKEAVDFKSNMLGRSLTHMVEVMDPFWKRTWRLAFCSRVCFSGQVCDLIVSFSQGMAERHYGLRVFRKLF